MENNEKYINAITVKNTFFDFTMDFKKESVYEGDKGQEKMTEEVGCVRMSPQMAKALAQLLEKNIKTYEEQFGTIPVLQKG